jgi:hypothetical protein
MVHNIEPTHLGTHGKILFECCDQTHKTLGIRLCSFTHHYTCSHQAILLYHCLNNFNEVLKRCEDTNIVLNWEKCHFMVQEGIVLGHKISGMGIEVDKAKKNRSNRKATTST